MPVCLLELPKLWRMRRFGYLRFLSRVRKPGKFPGVSRVMASQVLGAAAQSAASEGDGEAADISRDFCCFLCNGRQIVLGYVTLQPSFVRLSTCISEVLEEFEYSSVCSVNEEEPPTTHSLIFNLPHHSVYLCHLLRKELLLKVFQRLGVYKPDVRLPAESLGFPAGGLIVKPLQLTHCRHTCHCRHSEDLGEPEDCKQWPEKNDQKSGERSDHSSLTDALPHTNHSLS